MLRIKEILKEKNVRVAELADKLGVSRQALSRQISGKMLIETAEKIADALDVPLWQIFASKEEALGLDDVNNSLNALIEYKGNIFKASSLDELEAYVNEWKTNNK